MAQPKSFTLDGKRLSLSEKVPAHEIERFISGQHVGSTDAEILEIMATRCATWPSREKAHAANYALHCHRKNQRLVQHFNLVHGL